MNVLHPEVVQALEGRRDTAAQPVITEHGQYPEHRFVTSDDHLAALAAAIAHGSPALFADAVEWARVMLVSRGLTVGELAGDLEALRETLLRELPADQAEIASEYLTAGLRVLSEAPAPPASGEASVPSDPYYDLAQRYLRALLAGDRQAASQLILRSVEDGVGVKDIYLHVFQRTQIEIGRLWQTGEIGVAQEHYCTAATQLVMSQLYPYVFSSRRNGRVMVGTCIGGDLHEIGVRMVSDFFEMDGWDTYYLGANTPSADLVRTVVERRADVLAVSATLASHVRGVARLIAAVRAESPGVKVLVGGYPFNVDPELWRRIGADGHARDAAEAIELAKRLAAS